MKKRKLMEQERGDNYTCKDFRKAERIESREPGEGLVFQRQKATPQERRGGEKRRKLSTAGV